MTHNVFRVSKLSHMSKHAGHQRWFGLWMVAAWWPLDTQPLRGCAVKSTTVGSECQLHLCLWSFLFLFGNIWKLILVVLVWWYFTSFFGNSFSIITVCWSKTWTDLLRMTILRIPRLSGGKFLSCGWMSWYYWWKKSCTTNSGISSINSSNSWQYCKSGWSVLRSNFVSIVIFPETIATHKKLYLEDYFAFWDGILMCEVLFSGEFPRLDSFYCTTCAAVSLKTGVQALVW